MRSFLGKEYGDIASMAREQADECINGMAECLMVGYLDDSGKAVSMPNEIFLKLVEKASSDALRKLEKGLLEFNTLFAKVEEKVLSPIHRAMNTFKSNQTDNSYKQENLVALLELLKPIFDILKRNEEFSKNIKVLTVSKPCDNTFKLFDVITMLEGSGSGRSMGTERGLIAKLVNQRVAEMDAFLTAVEALPESMEMVAGAIRSRTPVSFGANTVVAAPVDGPATFKGGRRPSNGGGEPAAKSARHGDQANQGGTPARFSHVRNTVV